MTALEQQIAALTDTVAVTQAQLDLNDKQATQRHNQLQRQLDSQNAQLTNLKAQLPPTQ